MPARRDPEGNLELVYRSEQIGPPRVVFRFAEVDGRVILANVEVGANFTNRDEPVLQHVELDEDFLDNPEQPDPVPVTTADLRSLRLGARADKALADYVRALRRMLDRADIDDDPPEWRAVRKATERRLPPAEAGGERKRPGRPPAYGDDHYRDVASVYRDHAGGRSPTKAVAEHFNVSKAAAAKWVARARELAMLEPFFTEREER